MFILCKLFHVMKAISLKFLSIILPVAVLFYSCGSASNFGGFHSGKLKKIRVVQQPVSEIENNHLNALTLENKEFLEAKATSINEGGTQPEELSQEDEKVYFKPTLKPTSALVMTSANVQIQYPEIEEKSTELSADKGSSARENFDLNHYFTLSSFILGMLCGALGFLFFNVIFYAIAAAFIIAALVLAIMMKFYIAEKVENRDKKYKRRLWLANFLFYTLSALTILVFIAIAAMA